MTLSKNTSMSWNDLKGFQFHFVLGMMNSLSNIFEKERKAQEKAQAEQQSSSGSMSVPSMSSMMSQARSMMPSMPHF